MIDEPALRQDGEGSTPASPDRREAVAELLCRGNAMGDQRLIDAATSVTLDRLRAGQVHGHAVGRVAVAGIRDRLAGEERDKVAPATAWMTQV